MRVKRFDSKIRLAFVSCLMTTFLLSTMPWFSQYGMRSNTVLAQATTIPGTQLKRLGLTVSRTVLSHGRAENARQVTPINPNGLRDVQGFGDPILGTPGLLTTIASPSPAWQPDALHITMGWDPNFSPTPFGIGDASANPVTIAASGIPSCFTLVVADGVAAAFSGVGGSIPAGIRWKSTGPLIGEGNLYASVSIPAAGIVAGMDLRTEEQLSAYTANSIIWEAPPFGQVVQDTSLMQFGTKTIAAFSSVPSDPANADNADVIYVQVEVTRTLHVEIEVLGIEQNHDGSFRLCAIANMFGNSLEPVTSFWFRWGFDGQTVDLVGDVPGTNMVTIPHIPAAEKDQLDELYVVASCNGGTLTGNPFTAERLDAPPMVFVRKSIGLLTFVSGGCTLEDDTSVKIAPFGVCPSAHAMIETMQRTGPPQTGGENVWTRKTPTRGEVEFEKPEDAAKVTITDNSCTYSEVGPSGETSSNTITWTTLPERMIDDGKPVPQIPIFMSMPGDGTADLPYEERLARAVDKCRFKGQISVTQNPGALIENDPGFYQSDSAHGNRAMSGGVTSWIKDRRTAPVGFDIDRSGFAGPPRESFVVMGIHYGPTWGGEFRWIKIRWRYEYSRNEILATVTRDGQELEAREGMEVFEADRVRTQSNCKMALGIVGEKVSRLAALGVSESTDFEIRLLALGKPNRFDFALNSGKLRSEVMGERGRTEFRINTPTAAASVVGTVFTTAYDEQEQAGTVGVEMGAVLVTPTNPSLQPVTLNAGQQVKVTPANISTITAYSPGTSIISVIWKPLYIGIGAGILVFVLLLAFVGSRSKRSSTTVEAKQQPLRTPDTPLEPLINQPPPARQKICDKCGALLKPGKKFCTECGAPARASATESGTSSSAGVDGVVGFPTGPLIKLCANPKCKKPLVPGKWFCTNCGTRVM